MRAQCTGHIAIAWVSLEVLLLRNHPENSKPARGSRRAKARCHDPHPGRGGSPYTLVVTTKHARRPHVVAIEKDLFSRREFIKTLVVGTGIAGAGAAVLTAVMKAAGRGGGASFRASRKLGFPIGKDHCRVCERSTACSGRAGTAPFERCLLHPPENARARQSRRSFAEVATRDKPAPCIECPICESACPLGAVCWRR